MTVDLRTSARVATCLGALAIVLGCLVAPHALFSQQCGAGTTTFEWNTIHVAVAATDSNGVAFHAITPQVQYQGKHHDYFGWFDPDSAANWVAAATKVAEAQGAPDSGVNVLGTPPLMATDSSYIVVRREASDGKWRNDLTLGMITPKDSGGFRLIIPTTDADTLFRTLFGRAVQSRLVAGAGGVMPHDYALDSPPRPVKPGQVSYPMGADGRMRDGEVMAQFVVGIDGRADSLTFCTIASDGAEFTTAARDAILKTKFRPGQLHGLPVRSRVQQTVLFHSNIQPRLGTL